jgi:hypothetical protein
VDEEGK